MGRLGGAAWRIACVFMVIATANGAAAEPAAPKRKPSALERRVRELEKQNAELLRRLDRLERGGTEAAASSVQTAHRAEPVPHVAPAPPQGPATASATVRSEQAVAAADVEPTEPSGVGLGMTARYGGVRASFQFFGDAGAYWQNPSEPDTEEGAFAIGSLDIFGTTQLGDRFQVLNEIVLEGDSEENEVHVELERLWGAWTLDDELYVKVGREHSPVSHWNRRFHHGRWLWTSATQPLLARFEDDGGPLPVHQVGIEAGGRVRTRVGTLEYTGVVSNGRGREPDEVTNFGDRNEAKAYDVALAFSPVGVPHFTIGADVHLDEIPHLHDDPSRERAIRELIETAYIEYLGTHFEALGEIGLFQHDDRTSDHTFEHLAGYLQLGYRVGVFTPYTRLDGRDMATGDPFFAPDGIDLDEWEQVLGVRYDLNEYVAIKLEGAGGRTQRLSVRGNAMSKGFARIAAQLAWVF